MGEELDFFEELIGMTERLSKLKEKTGNVADKLFDNSNADINDLMMIERYIGMELRLLSEMTSLLVLENTIRAIFPDLRDTSAEKFSIVQKIINSVINDYVKSADAFRNTAGKYSATDNQFSNLQRDMIAVADDVLDMLNMRKDKLNEFMSEIGEQFQ